MSVPPEAEPSLLVDELERLLGDEQALSTLRRRLHDQIDRGFANEHAVAAERQVSAERRELHRRIDALRERLSAVEWEQQLPLDELRRLTALGIGPGQRSGIRSSRPL